MLAPSVVRGRTPSHRYEIDSRAKALLASRAALDKHAEGVVVMDLRTLSSVTDFFVICTADSAPQINAIKDHLEVILAQQRCPVLHVEGTTASRGQGRGHQAPQWVLMDCGDVVVHLLDGPARTFYQLEQLWADAPRVPLEVPGSSGALDEGHPSRSRAPR